MKKLIALMLCGFFLAGCQMNNGPLSESEARRETMEGAGVYFTPTPEPTLEITEEIIKNATDGLLVNSDEMTGESFYYSPSDHYLDEARGLALESIYYDNKPYFLPFTVHLKQNGTDVKVIIKIEWDGDDWIFFDKLLIKTSARDTATLNIPSYEKEEKVLDSGSVVERYYYRADDTMLEYLRSAAATGSCTIRLSGQTYYQTDLAPESIAAINDIMTAYDAINGASK